jgi:hypothetical protein
VRLTLLALSLTLITAAAPRSAQARPSLLLFEIEDRTGSLEATVLESLEAAVRQQAGRRYRLVDGSGVAKVRARLVAGGKTCGEGRCTVAIARELGASAALRVLLNDGGGNDDLVGQLTVLRRAGTPKTAQLSVPRTPAEGRPERLLAGVRSLLEQLFGATTGGTAASRAEARREAYERRKEQRREQSVARRQRYAERRVRSKRLSYQVYGWMAVGGGAVAAGLGAILMMKGIGDAEDDAAAATSSSQLETARDAASKARTSGIVLMALSGVAVGVGLYLLLSMPSLPSSQVAGVDLDLLPSVAPTRGGAAIGWGGRF